MHAHPHNISPQQRTPELWAGFECTVNRVGDSCMDQLELSGHAWRESDLDLLSELGVKAVRYPILWERVAPNGMHNMDWAWCDRRLHRLRELGIRPIVGLVHHGSGPRHTHLLDPAFPGMLADFAGAVARRYPWIEAYTPINEPLTTARFSCLYGHWYPHARDAQQFIEALLIECRAVVLAMRRIREINPDARLVQTEDLARIHSTPHLAYQADFENERRWWSFDLLCGRVDKDHMLREQWKRGYAEPFDWSVQNPCPPDVMGLNYYLSSERFLDDRVEHYPAHVIGGNAREPYADVEAVRVLKEGLWGAGELLREAWQRYGIPVALTELHNGCTREEQARWFVEQWNSAAALTGEGVDVRAITAWSLLGSFHWDKLVTCTGKYEPGVFDLRGPKPLPTLLTHILAQIGRGESPDHPVLAAPGWWRRPERHLFDVQCSSPPPGWSEKRVRRMTLPARPILITGRTGTLGQAFARICRDRGIPFQLLSRLQMDIARLPDVNAAIERYRPWAIVNTAGYVRVDDAEVESEACMRENTLGPSVLAGACASYGIQLVTFSSDLVFSGNKRAAYVESDPVGPLNVYGHSKAEAERAVLDLLPSALIVRASAFFGPWDRYNFVTATLRALSAGQKFVASSDYTVSPTYVPDLVNASLDLLLDGARGIWHLANSGAVKWSTLAEMAAEYAGVSTASLVRCANCQWMFTAPRPAYSVLGSERARFMPSLEDALLRYLHHPDLSWRKDVERAPQQESSGDVAA